MGGVLYIPPALQHMVNYNPLTIHYTGRYPQKFILHSRDI
jgi:hypothetical protein